MYGLNLKKTGMKKLESENTFTYHRDVKGGTLEHFLARQITPHIGKYYNASHLSEIASYLKFLALT
jgi:hypothetical protein